MEKKLEIGYNKLYITSLEGINISNINEKTEAFKNSGVSCRCEYGVEVKSSMAVGGKVAVVAYPTNDYQLAECYKSAKNLGLPIFVCGNLSNTIIKDGGYNGVFIRMGDNYSGYDIKGNIATVKAGTSMIRLARDLTEKGFGGLEFAGGIPGTVGGGVRMNAGAYDGQMSDIVKEVTYYNGKEFITTTDIGFGYRKSNFANMDTAIITQAVFELKNGGDTEKLKEFNRRRKEKQPLDKPNCGSVFKRPKNNYASKLVDECGLKGKRVGGAVVSEKHCGFIVNDDNATAKDVLTLMEAVKADVYEKTGVMLENEWVIVGED